MNVLKESCDEIVCLDYVFILWNRFFKFWIRSRCVEILRDL